MRNPHRSAASRRTGRSLTAPVLIGAAAALLGATAVAVRARAQEAERKHPPIGRFVTVDGVRLHYLERGRGKTVVLLHGNGSMIEELLTSGLVETLARTHRVIVFDRPGFGYSERPRSRLWTPAAQAWLIGQALDELGVNEAVVYGHSLGTQVAVSLALSHPGLVRGLVLASGYLYPTARADVPLLSPPAIPVVGDVMRYTISPVLTWLLLPRIYAKIFGPSPIPERFQREFPHDMLLRPWHLRAAAADTAFLIPTAAALQDRYTDLTMPVSVIAGESDRVAEPARHSVRLHQELPDSRLVLVPGTGHMIHHTALQQVIEAIETVSAQAFESSRPHGGTRVPDRVDRAVL